MKHKLAVFDFDGTIALKGKIPPETLAGIRHLQDIGYTTTLSTGRGYVRLQDVLGDNFDKVISADALLILEHGTKITEGNGKVAFVADFTADEVKHIVEFTRSNIEIVRLAWFNPVDPSSKVQVWCANAADMETEQIHRGHYANIFAGSLSELETLLLKGPVSNITLKLKNHVGVENLKLRFAHTGADMIFQDGNLEFIKNNTNKAIAIQYLLKHYGLSLEDVLVAGNAVNDIEMLDLGAKEQYFVAGEENFELLIPYLSEPQRIQRVDSPEALGLCLQAY